MADCEKKKTVCNYYIVQLCVQYYCTVRPYCTAVSQYGCVTVRPYCTFVSQPYAFRTKPNYLAEPLQVKDYEWCY